MSRSHKVLMVVENDVVPLDTRVWAEALALRDRGFQVSIIGPKGARERPIYADYRAPEEVREGIHIYRYELPEAHSAITYAWEYLVALLNTTRLSLRVHRRYGFDVLHVANPPDTFFPLGWLCHLLGKKFVFDQHDLAPEVFHEVFTTSRGGAKATVVPRLLRICERASYRAADLVIAANESFRRLAVERGGCDAEKVVVVRNASSLPQAEPAAPFGAANAEAVKLGRRFLLAYVGVMGIQDGVAYALRALHELIHTRGHQDVSLVLMGDGRDVPALRALTHQLRLKPYVTFTGWLSPLDVARYLSSADIGLSPEPLNALNDRSTMMKITDYMSMGLPIVAFDLAETRYTAQDAALYATPNAVSDFASKIETLLECEELRDRMGTVGRSRALGPLSWTHSQSRLLRAYDQLLGASVRGEVATAAVAALNREAEQLV